MSSHYTTYTHLCNESSYIAFDVFTWSDCVSTPRWEKNITTTLGPPEDRGPNLLHPRHLDPPPGPPAAKRFRLWFGKLKRKHNRINTTSTIICRFEAIPKSGRCKDKPSVWGPFCAHLWGPWTINGTSCPKMFQFRWQNICPRHQNHHHPYPGGTEIHHLDILFSLNFEPLT